MTTVVQVRRPATPHARGAADRAGQRPGGSASGSSESGTVEPVVGAAAGLLGTTRSGPADCARVTVVTAGVNLLKPGQKVTVLDAERWREPA